MNVETLLIQFSPLLSLEEVPLFRGAVLHALSQDTDVLLHNHTTDNYNYACPLVQYKSIDTKAAIFCIGEGVKMMSKLMRVCNLKVSLGHRQTPLNVEKVTPGETDIQVEQAHIYHLSDWLPLDDDNDRKFLRLRTDEDRQAFLERILVGNILSATKSLNIQITEKIECSILHLDRYHLQPWKNVKMRSFDVDFACNVTLPDYLGLGKHASFGFGNLRRYEE